MDPSSSRLTLTEGSPLGGKIFSIPFMLVGLGVPTGGAYFVFVENAPWLILLFMVPFGMIFFAAGAFAGWHQRWVILDAEKRTIERAWGVFFPWKRKEQPLGTWQHVGIGQERRRTQKN